MKQDEANEFLSGVAGKILGRFMLSGFDVEGTTEFIYKVCKRDLDVDLKDENGNWIPTDQLIKMVLEMIKEAISDQVSMYDDEDDDDWDDDDEDEDIGDVPYVEHEGYQQTDTVLDMIRARRRKDDGGKVS